VGQVLKPPLSGDAGCAAPNPYCVESAFCAAAANVVSQCASDPSTALNTLCWQNAPSQCYDGYVVAGNACSGTCVETDASCAFCDDGTYVPDPLCPISSSETCFDGGLYPCTCGYRGGTAIGCSASRNLGPVCVTASSPDAGLQSFCAPSSEPDPLCDGGSFCSQTEQLYVDCQDGYSFIWQPVCNATASEAV